MASTCPSEEFTQAAKHRSRLFTPECHLRVLHFFKTYYPDTFAGIEHAIYEVAESTALHGIESDVLSLSKTPPESPLRIDRHLAHKSHLDLQLYSTGISLSVFRDFHRLALQADLIHYHFPWPMMDLVHLTSPLRRPTVVTYHADIVRQRWLMPVYRPLMHAFLGSVDRIVATSQNYVDTSEVLQRYPHKVSVIPLGIAGVAPSPPALVESWRARVGEGFFLFVGTLRYYKGLHVLAEAARRTGYPVVVVGRGQMRDMLEQSNIPNLTVLGPLSDEDREAVLGLCLAFTFPSHLRAEAFGVSLLEAARAGKPMVSCELGTGTSYVNADGETGMVIPPSDPGALIDAMTELWNDRDKAQRMGIAARQRYVAKFRADQMGAAHAKLYRHILGIAEVESPRFRGAETRDDF